MQNLVELILLWCVGAVACASILKIWFDTTFLCLLIKTVKACGWKRDDADYWDVDQIEWTYWVRFQAYKWVEEKVPHWLHHLWGCPGCFGTHVAFWVSVVIAGCSQQWWMIPIGTVTYIAAGLYLFGKISNTTLKHAYDLKKKEKEWLNK